MQVLLVGRVSSYAGCMSPCFYWHTSGGYFYGVRLSNNFYWSITRTNVLCLLGFSAHSYAFIALSSFYDSLPSRDVQYPLRVVMLACFAYSLIPIQVYVPIPLVGSNACLICMFPHPTTGLCYLYPLRVALFACFVYYFTPIRVCLYGHNSRCFVTRHTSRGLRRILHAFTVLRSTDLARVAWSCHICVGATLTCPSPPMCIWCCGDVVSSCVFSLARTRLVFTCCFFFLSLGH